MPAETTAQPLNNSRRQHVENRLAGFKRDRLSFWAHWQELARLILPRRSKWLITPNQANRGSPINGDILDPTGTYAARTCAAGLFSGLCSPATPWFKLGIPGQTPDISSPSATWLAECESRMRMVMQQSNFYTQMSTLLFDLVVFGTSVAIIYEDFDDVIRLYVPCAGEYYLGSSSHLKNNALYREFTYTIAQVVEEFGLENCSDTVKSAYATASNWSSELVIGHAIEPNNGKFGIPSHFQWMELYWETGSSRDYVLRCKGFNEAPFFAARWDVTSNDSYGRSVGMDALPDIAELQHEKKRKAQAIDKMVTPPMVADIQMKNQPASLLPGAITYVAGLSNGVGFKPAYQIQPPIQELREDIAEIQSRVKEAFYNNLFLSVTDLNTVRSAEEIRARRAEQLTMLGPVVERFDNEGLALIVERVFAIMNRHGLLPPAPPEIQGHPIQIKFISMLSEAQRTASASGLEQWLAQLGNLAAVNPEVMDKIDTDATVDEYATLLSVKPNLVRSQKAVDALRAQRAQAQQQQALLEQTKPAVQGAQVLSQTNVGGGQNALQQILSGGQ